MKKTLCRMLSVLCAACLFAGCGSPIGEVTPKDVREDSELVRVMTYNVCGWDYKNIKELVPRLILEYSPDLIGLQECTYDWYKKLTKEMPEYGFIGVGRDTGTLEKNCGEMTAVLYKTEKYTPVDSGTFWLSETPETPSKGWDGDYIRICTWVIFKDNATGKEFVHVNTHLENIDDGTGREALKNGTQMLKEKIVSFGERPVIVTGDMNFEKNSEYYNVIIGAGFSDAQDLAISTMDGVTCPTERGGDNGEHIDYVFFNEKIAKVLNYKILRDSYEGKYPSDHYAIYADFKFQ